MDRKETRKLIRKVAKEYGKSVSEVKAEMEKSILSAYVFPNDTALSVPRNGDVPTIGELLDYLQVELKKDKTKN